MSFNKEDLNYSTEEHQTHQLQQHNDDSCLMNFDDDEHFECADAGAADTIPCQAGDLKKGDFVCIRGRPTKIVEMETFKNGKHGSAKCSITGEDLFTFKKYELVCPASYPMPCPIVTKSELQLIDISDEGELTLLDENFEERADLDLPLKDNESVARAIRAHFDNGKDLTLTVQKAMGIEQVMNFKVEMNCGK